MKWKLPPKIKIYEALGSLGDGRIEISGNTGKVYSSSGQKFYAVVFDPEQKSIMANDNGSYWQGYLGYPSIAFLMKTGIIKFNSVYSEALKGIAWKDINTEFENDFGKTADYVHEMLKERGIASSDFLEEVDSIYGQIEKLDLALLGSKTKPPQGY
ncbi:MAG: hypothetical protein WC848_05485 [Parcubacteria group bacterium]|jgi:hypothetical protein